MRYSRKTELWLRGGRWCNSEASQGPWKRMKDCVKGRLRMRDASCVALLALTWRVIWLEAR